MGQTEPTGHEKWDELLRSMSDAGGGSPAMLGEVLIRAAVAGEPVPRSEISKGSMLIRQRALASGTVGKAVEALVREELLETRTARKSGQPGPPITPLRLERQVGHHRDPHRPAA